MEGGRRRARERAEASRLRVGNEASAYRKRGARVPETKRPVSARTMRRARTRVAQGGGQTLRARASTSCATRAPGAAVASCASKSKAGSSSFACGVSRVKSNGERESVCRDCADAGGACCAPGERAAREEPEQFREIRGRELGLGRAAALGRPRHLRPTAVNRFGLGFCHTEWL